MPRRPEQKRAAPRAGGSLARTIEQSKNNDAFTDINYPFCSCSARLTPLYLCAITTKRIIVTARKRRSRIPGKTTSGDAAARVKAQKPTCGYLVDCPVFVSS